MRKRMERIKNDIKNMALPMVIFLGYILVGKLFLNSLCPSVVITGFPCPGCGMTRAVFCILQGKFSQAWYFHPFSYILILFGLCFCIRRYILMRDCKKYYYYLAVIFGAMVLFYVYRMVRYFPAQPPMSYYYGSLLYRILSRFGVVEL